MNGDRRMDPSGVATRVRRVVELCGAPVVAKSVWALSRAVVALLLLCTGALASTGDAADFRARVQADTRWLSEYGTRQVGTPAHARLQNDLLAKLREIPGVQVWTQEFPVVVPVNQETYLEIAGTTLPGRHAISPLWPDVARLNTTPAGGISGKLVYVGDAAYERLPAQGLHGAIAVMEMSAYADYRRVFDYGAAAVIFLESDRPEVAIYSNQSLYKPRYYVSAGPLADALRAGHVPQGRLVCRGKWETVTARNIYVGVKPVQADGRLPYAVVAAYDSMSRVLGVAPGADMALDCATVLNVLRDEARHPVRPLLFGFLDAYHINQLGMRQMAAMLTMTPNDQTRSAYAKIEEAALAEYRGAAAELAQFTEVDAGLVGLRDRKKCLQLRHLFKDAVGPELLHLETLQGEVRLASLRTVAEDTPTLRLTLLGVLDQMVTWFSENLSAELSGEERATLAAAQAFVKKARQDPAAAGCFVEARQHAAKLLPVCAEHMYARNRILEAVNSDKQPLLAGDRPLARAIWARMAARVRGQLADQEQRCDFFTPLDHLRREIASSLVPGVDVGERAICPFVVGVDLSDCGILVGPGVACAYNRLDATMVDRDFSQALKRAVKKGAIWPLGDPARRVVNLGAIEGRVGGVDAKSGRAVITSAAKSFFLPGITWVTDDAPRRCVDSPLDRFDRMDWARIDPQLPATCSFLNWLFTTKEFTGATKRGSEVAGEWRHGMGSIVDVSAGETVPRVPRAGFLVTLLGYSKDTDGIRRNEFAWTGEDGSFRIPLLCAHVHEYQRKFELAAFKMDDNGAITEALSTSESLVTTHLTTSFSLSVPPGEQLPRAVTFVCTELNGPSFFDARFLEPLTKGSLQDAVRGGAPKRSCFSIDLGQMWGLVEPGTQWQLVLKAGAGRVRMALLNALPDGRAQKKTLRETFQRGFPVAEPLPTIPAQISAQDIYALDSWRLADFKAAGIQSQKIDDMHAATRAALDEVSAAVKQDNGAALQRLSGRALADEIRAYQAVTDMGLDISRGAIFLMLMLVPFSVAMERLLFACAKIGGQIMAGMAIFAGMTVLLWSFHPAFRISSQPLVIVMAFAILAMSLIVISMVLNRFKSAVQQFQSAMAEGSGANMGRDGLLGSAIFLGIANMRKRKVRTLLTGATIVLVTFALLCFSSASSYVDRKDFRIEGVTAGRASVLIRRPTVGPLSWTALPAVRNLLGDAKVPVGARVWLSGEQGDATWRIYLVNPKTGAQVPLLGALGLPPMEDRLTGVDRVLTHWPDFAAQGGCYISKDSAEQLGVAAGDTLVMRGRALVVRGVFDPLRLEDEVTQLDGLRILPYDYSRLEQDWIDRDSQSAVEQETGSAESMQPAGNDADRYIPARDLIIVPSEILQDFGGTLRSLGLCCSSPEQASAVAKRLTETIVYPAYYSNRDGGVNVVVSTPLIALPPKNLAIPLIVAALIIFTTMLNSVSERKREIYVYTSLGLAPTHIGALFVAEALTYGLMGSVFGYVAGQGTATLLTAMGWMHGVTLNYSGAAVIRTMLLVQAVVVLSAIVPAIVASRIASPSSETDWKVPNPVDGIIRDFLPFTINVAAAPGLVAFMHEYLDAHREGVLGGFDVDEVRLLQPGTVGGVAGIEARVWLAPFDMGVRQTLRFRVESPDDGACSISVEIRHESGMPKTWWRLNKPFFADLRRQLLGWRKLSPDRIAEYVKRGRG